ncbi:hypothetical protein [Acidithiobacillus sp.]|jgi:type II secretory pathway pseudopilin PulG|uniref:hypothetical protein n=1 Tax=Acidithiobacillus sp. TaxID=1872118 RepID=UPI002638168A|nr:hypothetical protein [Acidithiobacillus sp.]
MWFILLVIALIIIAAQAMLWRLQRHLLAALQISQERTRALEEAVQRIIGGQSQKEAEAPQRARNAPDRAIDAWSLPEEGDEVNRYQRAHMLADSGRNAHYIASTCQIGEEEAELLIRLKSRPSP